MYKEYEAWQYQSCPAWLQQGVVPLTAGFLAAESNYEVCPRILQDYFLVWMRNGRGILKTKGKQFTLKKNDIFILFPNEVHSYHTDPEERMVLYWVGFGGISAGKMVECAGFTPENPVFSCKDSDRLLDVLNGITHCTGRNGLDGLMEVSGLTTCLFGMLISMRGEKKTEQTGCSVDFPEASSLATVVHNYINMYYPRKIAVSDLAKLAGVSQSQLTRLFQNELGQSPSQYLRYVRMQRAVTYLTQTDMSIREISGRVGYDDPFYFTKVFTSKYGLPPSGYRKKVRAVETFRF